MTLLPLLLGILMGAALLTIAGSDIHTVIPATLGLLMGSIIGWVMRGRC